MDNWKEVWFGDYCKDCKYSDEAEDSDICNECLTECARLNSHKPVNFKEKD